MDDDIIGFFSVNHPPANITIDVKELLKFVFEYINRGRSNRLVVAFF